MKSVFKIILVFSCLSVPCSKAASIPDDSFDATNLVKNIWNKYHLEPTITVEEADSPLNSLAAVKIKLANKKLHRSLVLNSHKISQLAAGEQEFVILHEAGHLQQNLGLKLITNLVSTCAPYAVAGAVLCKKFSRNYYLLAQAAAWASASGYCAHSSLKFINAAFARADEYEADR